MIDAATRRAALEAIRTHLETIGPRDWSLVRARFPAVPSATWWRWVRQIKESTPSAAIFARIEALLETLFARGDVNIMPVILRAIGEASPETARKILARLEEEAQSL